MSGTLNSKSQNIKFLYHLNKSYTNNEARYKALIVGLELTILLGI